MGNIYDTKKLTMLRAEAEVFRENTLKILPPGVKLSANLMDLVSNQPDYVQQALSNLRFRGNLIFTPFTDSQADGIMLLAESMHLLWAIQKFNSGLAWNNISGPHYDVKLLPWEVLQAEFPEDAKFFTDSAEDIAELLNCYGYVIIP